MLVAVMLWIKGETTITADGVMHTRSQYLRNGQWVDEHEIIYKESPEARVIFR